MPLLKLDNNQKFRNNNQLARKKIVLVHPGYGGSSDGNLTLEDYLKLAKVVGNLPNIQVVWVFGPDDLDTKDKIIALIPDADIVYHPPTLLDYCFLIRDSELLVSTSTGPMHLAGVLNIKTVSFFGSNLFASSKRWATVSEANKQLNIEIDKNYQQDLLKKIIDPTIQKLN